jgi:hypothetical protein
LILSQTKLVIFNNSMSGLSLQDPTLESET